MAGETPDVTPEVTHAADRLDTGPGLAICQVAPASEAIAAT